MLCVLGLFICWLCVCLFIGCGLVELVVIAWGLVLGIRDFPEVVTFGCGVCGLLCGVCLLLFDWIGFLSLCYVIGLFWLFVCCMVC